jgi:fermentation-respiration switch protein FrsA (DUF1100 family)
MVAERRRLIRRALIGLVLLIVFGYSAAIVRLMLQETELIFRTGAARADTKPSFAYEQIDLPRTDGARQFAWIMRNGSPGVEATNASSSDRWVLYLHGNASTVASRMNVAHYRRLRELGLHVLAPEYQGYNGLQGVPSEASVQADARAAYEYLRSQLHVPPDRLVIFGWSLGAAVAVHLASQVDAGAVVLEGAPASVVDIGQQRYPFFPIRWIIRNPFNAIEHVAAIRAPLLFLHSPEDTIIPFAEGRRLFDAAPKPKTFVEVRGGHVEASEVDREIFYGAIRDFLAGLAPR